MSIAALLSTDYTALNDIDTLNALKARKVEVFGMAPSGEMLAYIASINKLSALEAVANDETSPLCDLAKATLTTLMTREGFNFAIPAVCLMLDAFVAASLFTAEEASAMKAIGTKLTPEFPSVAMKDIIAIRYPAQIATSPVESPTVEVSCSRNQGVMISATVSGLPAQTNIEVWIARSVDGVSYTDFIYSGAITVASEGTVAIAAPPQTTLAWNKVKLLSQEYVVGFADINVVAY